MGDKRVGCREEGAGCGYLYRVIRDAPSGVSLQRSSDLNVPGSEGNMAKPSDQGHQWKPGADSQGKGH